MTAAKRDLFQRHGFSMEKLRAAVQRDPTIRAEATEELAAVEPFAEGGLHEGRCVISKEYAEVLREALA